MRTWRVALVLVLLVITMGFIKFLAQKPPRRRRDPRAADYAVEAAAMPHALASNQPVHQPLLFKGGGLPTKRNGRNLRNLSDRSLHCLCVRHLSMTATALFALPANMSSTSKYCKKAAAPGPLGAVHVGLTDSERLMWPSSAPDLNKERPSRDTHSLEIVMSTITGAVPLWMPAGLNVSVWHHNAKEPRNRNADHCDY